MLCPLFGLEGSGNGGALCGLLWAVPISLVAVTIGVSVGLGHVTIGRQACGTDNPKSSAKNHMLGRKFLLVTLAKKIS
jgi:hypothetical protein